MAIKLTSKEINVVQSIFPKLKGNLKDQIIEGDLEFCVWFDQETQELEHDSQKKDAIKDTYAIKVNFQEEDAWGLPKVYETKNKIQDYADKHTYTLEDLHINSSGDCCLGIYPQHTWHGSLDFIQNKVISFFYWQSHLSLHGKEPWAGYSHGNRGIEEVMSMNPKDACKGRYRNKPCQCNSGRKYKICCLKKDEILKGTLNHAKKYDL